jgi:hypothetical protein
MPYNREPPAAYVPRRRRRRWPWLVGAVLVAVVAAGTVPRVIAASKPHDYRDAEQLARAIKGTVAAKGDGTPVSSACSHITGNAYVCSVAFSDLTEASYQVTVAGDGRSYTVSS